MKNQFIVSTVLGLASAALQPGKCPDYAGNKHGVFEPKEMAGLWFEYVWQSGYTDDYGYDCATWTVLADGDDKFVVYNHMKWTAEEEADEKSDFIKFDF